MSCALYNYKIDSTVFQAENEVILCDLLNVFYELANSAELSESAMEFIMQQVHEYSLLQFPCICIKPTCIIHKMLLEGCLLLISTPFIYQNSTHVIDVITALQSIVRCHDTYPYFTQYSIISKIMQLHIKNVDVYMSIIKFLNTNCSFTIHYKNIPQSELLNTIISGMNYHRHNTTIQIHVCNLLCKFIILTNTDCTAMLDCIIQAMSLYPYSATIQYYACKIFKNLPTQTTQTTPQNNYKENIIQTSIYKAFPYILQILFLHEKNEKLIIQCIQLVTQIFKRNPESIEYIKTDTMHGLKLFCYLMQTHFYSYKIMFNIIPTIALLANDIILRRRIMEDTTEYEDNAKLLPKIMEQTEMKSEIDQNNPLFPTITVPCFGYSYIPRHKITEHSINELPQVLLPLIRRSGTEGGENYSNNDFDYSKCVYHFSPSTQNLSTYMGLLLQHYMQIQRESSDSESFLINNNLAELWTCYSNLCNSSEICFELLMSPADSTVRKLGILSQALTLLKTTPSWCVKSSIRTFLVTLATNFPYYSSIIEWDSWYMTEKLHGTGINNLRLHTSKENCVENTQLYRTVGEHVRELIYIGENDRISINDLVYIAACDKEVNAVSKLLVFTGVQLLEKRENLFQEIRKHTTELYLYSPSVRLVQWKELDAAYLVIQEQLLKEHTAFVYDTFKILPRDICHIITEFIRF